MDAIHYTVSFIGERAIVFGGLASIIYSIYYILTEVPHGK